MSDQSELKGQISGHELGILEEAPLVSSKFLFEPGTDDPEAIPWILLGALSRTYETFRIVSDLEYVAGGTYRAEVEVGPVKPPKPIESGDLEAGQEVTFWNDNDFKYSRGLRVEREEQPAPAL